MTERPILFNGEMVRAILAGKKTQTRRVMKPMRHPYGNVLTPDDIANEFRGLTGAVCPPLGREGDRLWVRESFNTMWEPDTGVAFVEFAAGGNMEVDKVFGGGSYDPCLPNRSKGMPSIHMPRWASRLTLEVTAVRIERLQDISEADARAEGLPEYLGKRYMADLPSRHRFRALWRSIYGDASWDANPWVWVYEFKIAERKDGK